MMVVMPGWNNHKGMFVYRNSGKFYVDYCWERVTLQKPQIVIINSFNDFAELTAVEPADTRSLPERDQWRDKSGHISNDMYWNITSDYVQQMKKLNKVDKDEILSH
jgi:hypothetical protein